LLVFYTALIFGIMNWKKNWTIWIVVAFTGTLFSFKFADKYFEIAKNLDLYASVVREINSYYVDEIDAGKLNKKAIDEMLKSLDPYTVFISEAEAEDFRFQMTGQYGGIGSQVVQRNDYVMISDPYEGYAAQKADLRAGDLILAVDGKSAKGKSTSDMSKLLKGQAGTIVKLSIKRGNETLEIPVTREEIKLKNVPYYGLINPTTGYIKLSSFTGDAGEDVRKALVDLKTKNISQVILDVRGNPGGLLNEAINIVNLFVPKGQLVVTTKGKTSEWNKSYLTNNQATDTQIPLVVLTNKGSASASEIVSGTIQDLDRGIVIGQRTFGKGLVQSTRPLQYNTQIKITTAKYYTPSGRCIQALDYSHRNEDGSVGNMPDSLKKAFKTKNGRTVLDGGGVEPDLVTALPPLSLFTQTLISQFVLFDFATMYRQNHPSLQANSQDFTISNDLYDQFKKYVMEKDVKFVSQSEQELENFKKKAVEEKYFEGVQTAYEQIKKQLAQSKEQELMKNKTEICSLLTEEIVRRYYFQNGRTEATFKFDTEIQEALKLFADAPRMKTILSAKQ
jgi:carboxyl-terminal processing protease